MVFDEYERTGLALSGYYIIQFVERNLAGRASVIADRDPTTEIIIICSYRLQFATDVE